MSDIKENISLAVLMTCHNRIESTLECLKTLSKQKFFDGLMDIFLVDDGSIDGTSLAVSQSFPNVIILQGDGNLYWCGGMRLAFTRAIKENYDFYLWLNDDTSLYDDALVRIFQTYSDASPQFGDSLIVIGSTCDPESGDLSYGGWRKRAGKFFSITWEKIPPNANKWITCDTMNGNCVLISNSVVKKIGNLDINFTHSMGDLDYGLRAKKAGCQIIVSPGYYGKCGRNDGSGLWVDQQLSVLVRWKKLLGPKGLPIKEWLVFSRRHKGRVWPLVWISPYFIFWVNVFRDYLK